MQRPVLAAAHLGTAGGPLYCHAPLGQAGAVRGGTWHAHSPFRDQPFQACQCLKYLPLCLSTGFLLRNLYLICMIKNQFCSAKELRVNLSIAEKKKDNFYLNNCSKSKFLVCMRLFIMSSCARADRWAQTRL